MKQNIIFAAMALIICSCGSSRGVSSSNQTYQRDTQVNNYTAPAPAQTTAAQANQPRQAVQASAVARQAIDNQAPTTIDMIEWGFGRSGDRARAQRNALRSAQNNIAVRLYRTMTIVDTEFGEDIEIGDNINTSSHRAEMIVGVIDRKTATISYTKEPVFSRVNGVWECEVEVKLSPETLRTITHDIYNSLSSDDELRVRFNEQQFYDNVYTTQLNAYRESQNARQ